MTAKSLPDPRPLLDATNKLRNFRKRHADLVSELESLTALAESHENELKQNAKRHAVPGETVVVLDTDQIKVQVIGGVSAPDYSPDVLYRELPRALWLKIQTIDSKRVEALVELGEIKPEIIEKAKLPRKPIVPRVKVEVFGK